MAVERETGGNWKERRERVKHRRLGDKGREGVSLGFLFVESSR